MDVCYWCWNKLSQARDSKHYLFILLVLGARNPKQESLETLGEIYFPAFYKLLENDWSLSSWPLCHPPSQQHTTLNPSLMLTFPLASFTYRHLCDYHPGNPGSYPYLKILKSFLKNPFCQVLGIRIQVSLVEALFFPPISFTAVRYT